MRSEPRVRAPVRDFSATPAFQRSVTIFIMRIGLFTTRERKKTGQSSTVTLYVEASTPAELSARLAELGAKRAGLLKRDRTGTTSLEGKMFAPSEVTEQHLAWLAEKPAEFQTRGVFFEH